MLRFALAPVALVSLVTPALLLAPTATAASGPFCTAGHCVVRFDFTGAPEYFTVPSGVTVVSATVSGASGGPGDGATGSIPGAGGRGGTVTVAVPVAGGDQLRIVVGSRGGQGIYAQTGVVINGGYGGGGKGVYDGSGGGGSYLSRGTSLLVVAGGGGGGGSGFSGPGNVPTPGGDGGAGTNGHAGSPAALGGPGGTTSGPGAPADCAGQATTVGTGPAAPPTTFGVGGSGDNGCGTDGGGGGYYGGSSGGYDNGSVDGGAGGGSGFLAPGLTGVAGTPNDGQGVVTLAYDLPKTATTTTLRITPASVPAGGTTTLTAAVTSATGTPTGTVTFVDKTHNVTLGTATLANGLGTLVLPVGNTAGTRSVVATYGGSGIYGAATSQAATLTVTKVPVPPTSTPTPTPTSTPTPDPTSSTSTGSNAPLVPVAGAATAVAGRASFTG